MMAYFLAYAMSISAHLQPRENKLFACPSFAHLWLPTCMIIIYTYRNQSGNTDSPMRCITREDGIVIAGNSPGGPCPERELRVFAKLVCKQSAF